MKFELVSCAMPVCLHADMSLFPVAVATLEPYPRINTTEVAGKIWLSLPRDSDDTYDILKTQRDETRKRLQLVDDDFVIAGEDRLQINVDKHLDASIPQQNIQIELIPGNIWTDVSRPDLTQAGCVWVVRSSDVV